MAQNVKAITVNSQEVVHVLCGIRNRLIQRDLPRRHQNLILYGNGFIVQGRGRIFTKKGLRKKLILQTQSHSILSVGIWYTRHQRLLVSEGQIYFFSA